MSKELFDEIDRLQTKLGQAQMRIIELENELRPLRKSWWPELRKELEKPEYKTLVDNRDAVSLFEVLSKPSVTIVQETLPISVVRELIAKVLAGIALSSSVPDNVKTIWRTLLLDLVSVIGDGKQIPVAIVQSLIIEASNYGLLPSGYVIGNKEISILEAIQLQDKVTRPSDIREAMGWGDG